MCWLSLPLVLHSLLASSTHGSPLMAWPLSLPRQYQRQGVEVGCRHQFHGLASSMAAPLPHSCMYTWFEACTWPHAKASS